ncbi:retrovirus-related pol polyprotein from transposon TNT 1-94, partial [Tanacetum coccineum]
MPGWKNSFRSQVCGNSIHPFGGIHWGIRSICWQEFETFESRLKFLIATKPFAAWYHRYSFCAHATMPDATSALTNSHNFTFTQGDYSFGSRLYRSYRQGRFAQQFISYDKSPMHGKFLPKIALQMVPASNPNPAYLNSMILNHIRGHYLISLRTQILESGSFALFQCRQPLSWLGRANFALDVGSELEEGHVNVAFLDLRFGSQPEPEVSYVSSEGNHNTLMYVGNSVFFQFRTECRTTPAEDVTTIFVDVTTSMDDVGVSEIRSLGGCMPHVVTTEAAECMLYLLCMPAGTVLPSATGCRQIVVTDNGQVAEWRERFMNYLKEQTDGEAMINSIQNGDHPLPVIDQLSLAGTAPNAPPTLKDPKFWTAEEKKNRKIDRLARSLLIQGLPNDIYSLIDSNDTAKDLWDALERQMRGSEYGEQDRKAAILYEYETFKATEGEQLLDTYLRYLQVINDLKKCGYKKDNCELNYKFLNNLQPEWKQYGTLMRQTKNLMDINIDALYNILKQNQGDVNDAMGYKKKAIVVTSDPLALVAEKTKVSKRKEKVVVQSESEGSDDEDISDLKKITALLAKAFNRKKYYAKPTNNNLRTSSASSSANKKPEYVKSEEKKEDKKVDEKKRDMSKVKCYNCKKEGHFAKDCKKAKVKDYNYYKTKMLLANKDSDEQVLIAEDQAWMESNSDSDQEINANMGFMAKMEKVL